MWNVHLVQRLAERQGSSCVAVGEWEERCAYLALVFGLVHLLANIPIWLGRKGLQGVLRFVIPFLYMSFISVFHLDDFPSCPCALLPDYSHSPLHFPTTAPWRFAMFLIFTRMRSWPT